MDPNQPPNVKPIDRCPADGPVGSVIMGLAATELVATFAVGPVWNALASVFQGLPTTTPSFDLRSAFNGQFSGQSSWVPVALMFCAVLLCAVIFFAGQGIQSGYKTGFVVAAFCFALLTLLGNGFAFLGMGVVVYCVLRLLAVIGPLPVDDPR